MVQLATFLLMFFWLGVFFTDHFWLLAFVLLGYSFFQNAILAQFEAVTIAHLGTQRELYSRLRLWGSVGFIVTGASLGMFFDYVSIGWLPLCLLVFAAASWLASLRVPDIATPTRAHRQEDFFTILKRPTVVAFLLAHFLLQLSHAPYYSFYSIYLEAAWLFTFSDGLAVGIGGAGRGDRLYADAPLAAPIWRTKNHDG
jgi:PPP family 3-phenylpropionic acid transporter